MLTRCRSYITTVLSAQQAQVTFVVLLLCTLAVWQTSSELVPVLVDPTTGEMFKYNTDSNEGLTMTYEREVRTVSSSHRSKVTSGGLNFNIGKFGFGFSRKSHKVTENREESNSKERFTVNVPRNCDDNCAKLAGEVFTSAGKLFGRQEQKKIEP